MTPKVHYGSEPPANGYRLAEPGKWVKDAPKVAVVGGGPGGLFASYILNQKIPRAAVTLYESSDRLGGKIRTGEFSDGTPYEAGVAELYEYLGPGGKDPLRLLIEDDLGLFTKDMAGGCVVLGEDVLHDLDAVEKLHSEPVRKLIEQFHKKCAALMPLEAYANRWQPDNAHPWAPLTFRECIRRETGDGPEGEVARRYIEAAVASDLATESWTCNGLNGIKNVLMDNPEYMKLYHVVGGIGRVAERLSQKIDADVRLGCRATAIEKTEGGQYCVSCRDGDLRDSRADYDAVFVCLPNHWLSQVRWVDPVLGEALHGIMAHYDLPAHYLRVSLLFEKPWWRRFGIEGDYWMMENFNGVCCYDESARWKSRKGHVLSFLLNGADALLLCSHNQSDECIVDFVVAGLPEFMRHDADELLVEGRVDRYAGSINAQPGGWPVGDLKKQHRPEPAKHKDLYLVGDYFFDSTLNAALMSAGVAVDLLVESLGVEPGDTTEALEQLEPEGGVL